MKNMLSLILLLAFSTHCLAQIKFEKGYFIKNSGEKIECFIKNVDWKNNPTEFEYKISEKGNIETTHIELVKEFGINNILKYKRYIVDIDISGTMLDDLSYDPLPINEKREVFLKVLTEGDVNLLYYEHKNLQQFFYQKEEETPKQLVYKKFLKEPKQLLVNDGYKTQILLELPCDKISKKDTDNLKYTKNQLVNIFKLYNNCDNNAVTAPENTTNKKNAIFNVALKPRLNSSSLKLKHENLPIEIKFDNELSFAFGVEIESILSFNKYKWSLVFEPTYQTYKTTKTATAIASNFEVDYKSLELPIGVRYYSYLKNNTINSPRIFYNAFLTFDVPFSSKIGGDVDYTIESFASFSLGSGYKYKNISAELRYNFGREILNLNTNWESKYSSLSLILGYKIL